MEKASEACVGLRHVKVPCRKQWEQKHVNVSPREEYHHQKIMNRNGVGMDGEGPGKGEVEI